LGWDIQPDEQTVLVTLVGLHYWARASIIQVCPNLNSVSKSGDQVGFPFCSRVAGRGAVPLLGLSSNLTTINFERGDYEPTMLVPNLIWQLLNLPNLDQGKS